jgi:hypothetical protein
MDPAVRAILEANGCEGNLEDPPAQYETTERMIGSDEMISSMDTEKLTALAGRSAAGRGDADRYWHVRQYYINQARGQRRDAEIEEKLVEIENVLKNGDPDGIAELFRQRHLWRQQVVEHMTDCRPICSVPDCYHVSAVGSEFCINHILLDREQKLFVECPVCHRPYPIMSSCFGCRTDE